MSRVNITPKAVERLAGAFERHYSKKAKRHADNPRYAKPDERFEPVAATLRAQAERITELEATLTSHRADRPFVIGWNDGFQFGVNEAARVFDEQWRENSAVKKAAILALVVDDEQTPPSAAQEAAS